MSSITYGTQVFGTSTRTVSDTDSPRPGAVYEATYAISGVRTWVPGWENDAINEVKRTIESNGGQVVYIAIRNDDVVVQWKYSVPAISANAHAVIAPVIIGMVLFAVIVALGIWLIVTATSSAKEISGLMTDNPQTTIAIYGALIVAALFAAGYIMRQRSDV